MNTTLLNKKFEFIGARLKIVYRDARRFRTGASRFSLDIGEDRRGEFFEMATLLDTPPEVEVLDVQRPDRHLLLLFREGAEKSKYLCGHDERHWFVAGIPESAPVGTVRQAMEALQPIEVQAAVAHKGLKSKSRNRRKNAAFVRQGEWFFLPVPSLEVPEDLLLRNEPLSRGQGSKPHLVDFCYRTGGELVYVCRNYPAGVTETQYALILERNESARNWGWRTMRRNPNVYVRGKVRHSDHATILLGGWHRVVMNTESQAKAMQNVVFLD
ncbi:hypothetical protein SH449x_000395 [Pirellulaceae bacterium SH449]